MTNDELKYLLSLCERFSDCKKRREIIKSLNKERLALIKRMEYIAYDQNADLHKYCINELNMHNEPVS